MSTSKEPISDSTAQAIKVLAPIVTMGATWLVTRGLNAGYRGLTGNQPPKASDPSEPMRKVILWSLVTACAVTVVNIGVDRWVASVNSSEKPTITA